MTSTTARGYGTPHQTERQRWAPYVAQGIVPCARCSRIIPPGTPWDLDHNETRTGYIGPSHRACNRAAGARKINAIRSARRASRTVLAQRW
jgi:hypothetical protein